MADNAIVVENLAGLQKAFRLADKTASRELKTALRDAIEPIRSASERLAVSNIENIGPRWSNMRVGVTQRMVYVAPVERGRGSKRNARIRRPNLKTKLLDEAMGPALDQNRGQAEARIERVLDTVARAWETA